MAAEHSHLTRCRKMKQTTEDVVGMIISWYIMTSVLKVIQKRSSKMRGSKGPFAL